MLSWSHRTFTFLQSTMSNTPSIQLSYFHTSAVSVVDLQITQLFPTLSQFLKVIIISTKMPHILPFIRWLSDGNKLYLYAEFLPPIISLYSCSTEWARALDWRPGGPGFKSCCGKLASDLWQFHLPHFASVFRMRH